MHSVRIAKQVWLPLAASLIFAISPLGSYSSIAAAADIKVTLAGDQEVPPVKSAGAGTGTIIIGTHGTVSGLYVNVHTAANPGGEIRGQLKP